MTKKTPYRIIIDFNDIWSAAEAKNKMIPECTDVRMEPFNKSNV